MNRFTFIFIVCLYALFIVYQANSVINLESQIIYSSFFILLFGIPHGAIDHILFFRKKHMSQIQFYSLYLGLIGVFAVSWIFFPITSFVFFLVLSAFHFGESQFVDSNISLWKYKPILFLFWGLSLLATLMYYNFGELAAITKIFKDTQGLSPVYNPGVIFLFFVFTNFTSTALIVYLYLKKHITAKRFTSELFLIFLIHLTFFLFPFIIGFTLYFVVLHSIRVMSQEYLFFKKENKDFSVRAFIKMLLPYSLLSIFGTTALMLLSHYGVLNISIPLLSIIIISVVTLPHAIVMHIFYNK